MTLLEVILASVVVTVLTLSAAAAFSENIEGVTFARRMTSGVLFLETVHESVGAQDAAALLVLNGDQYFDGNDATDSEFRVDLTAFEVEVDLLQVELSLFDVSSGRRLGRVTTLRSAG